MTAEDDMTEPSPASPDAGGSDEWENPENIKFTDDDVDELDEMEHPDISLKEYIDGFFEEMDVDGDGQLTREEIITGLLGNFESDVWSQADLNENGILDVPDELENFGDMLDKYIKAETLDTDGDGIISQEEAKQYTQQQIDEEYVNKADKDGDGIITYDEMASFFTESMEDIGMGGGEDEYESMGGGQDEL